MSFKRKLFSLLITTFHRLVQIDIFNIFRVIVCPPRYFSMEHLEKVTRAILHDLRLDHACVVANPRVLRDRTACEEPTSHGAKLKRSALATLGVAQDAHLQRAKLGERSSSCEAKSPKTAL